MIVVAKGSPLGQTMKHYLLSVEHMRDNNGEGEVYDNIRVMVGGYICGEIFQRRAGLILVFPWTKEK